MKDLVFKVLADLYRLDKNFYLLREFNAGDLDVDVMFNGDKAALNNFFLRRNAIMVGGLEYGCHIQYHLPVVTTDKTEYIIFDFQFDNRFGKDIRKYDIPIERIADQNDIILNDYGVPVVSPKLQYVLLYIHEYLENVYTKRKKRQREIDNLYRPAYSSIELQVNGVEVILSKIADIEGPVKLVIKRLFFIIIKAFFFTKRRIRNRKSVSIVFAGVDGSGKTTIAECLMRRFNNRGNNAVRVYNGEQTKIPANKIYKIANHSYYCLRQVITRNLSLFKGGLFLNDRNYYDRYYPSPLTKYFSQTRRRIIKILMFLTPRPNLVFFLEGNPEVLSVRKGEFSIELTAHGQEQLRGVMFEVYKNVICIDSSNKTASDLCHEVDVVCSNYLRALKYNA